MRCLERNKQPFYYSVFKGNVDIVDEKGRKTGEKKPNYSTPVMMKANISPATGRSQQEQFGNVKDYDHVFVTDDVNCPIGEETVLFVDVPPSFNKDGIPLHDYVVKRVSKSINSISYAIASVKVT